MTVITLPLIEIPDSQLDLQLADQYDAWRAAESEAEQAVEIALEERRKLDKILGEKMDRQKRGGFARPLLEGPVP